MNSMNINTSTLNAPEQCNVIKTQKDYEDLPDGSIVVSDTEGIYPSIPYMKIQGRWVQLKLSQFHYSFLGFETTLLREGSR